MLTAFFTLSSLAVAAPPPPIVNGSEVDAGDWSSVALVWSHEDEWCTGVLVSPRVVLTAGHCIRGATHVSFGTEARAGRRYSVASKASHPRWARTYDVGILELDEAPDLDVVTLSTSKLEDGVRGTIVGWGLTDKDGERETPFLQEATVGVWDHDCSEKGWDCNRAVQPGGELVAGGYADSCTGDSGGPLFQQTGAGPVLVGIVSRSVHPSDHMCGDGGIYVRADAVAGWVEQTAGVELDWDGYREPGSTEWTPKTGRRLRGCATAGATPIGWLGLVGMGLVLIGRRRSVGA